MKCRRLWCQWCRHRVLFPTVHFVVHILDALTEEAADGKV